MSTRSIFLSTSRATDVFPFKKTLCNYELLPHFAPPGRHVENNHAVIIDVTDSHGNPLEVSARRVSCSGLEMKPRTRIELL